MGVAITYGGYAQKAIVMNQLLILELGKENKVALTVQEIELLTLIFSNNI